VSVGGWGGSISVIPPASSGFVFAGPTTTLTTTASQSIVASGSAALATSGPTVTAQVAVCVSPTGANTPSTLDSIAGLETVGVGGPFTSTYAVSETGAPGAGTWDVGMCVVNEDSTTPIDQNQSSVGYAFVVNGTPVSELPKTTSKSSHH
jgi:hypothetical protein